MGPKNMARDRMLCCLVSTCCQVSCLRLDVVGAREYNHKGETHDAQGIAMAGYVANIQRP